MTIIWGPVTDKVKVVNCGLVTYSECNLARWKKYFCVVFNVHGVNEVRQTEIHTAEPIFPEFSDFYLKSNKIK